MRAMTKNSWILSVILITYAATLLFVINLCIKKPRILNHPSANSYSFTKEEKHYTPLVLNKPLVRKDLWVYDLFTPPRIIYNQVSKSYFAMPVLIGKYNECVDGLVLKSFSRREYFLRFEGYLHQEDSDLIFLFDTQKSVLLTLRVGDNYDGERLVLKSFQAALWDDLNQKLNDPLLEIIDYDLNQTLFLKLGEPALLEKWSIELGNTLERKIIFNEIGETQHIDGSELTLRLVDVNARCVILESQKKGEDYPEYIYLQSI